MRSAGTLAPPVGSAYRRVLAAPGVMPLSIATVLARLPVSMSALGLVLYVRHVTGSFAAAGVAAAGFTVGLGVTAPLLGRFVDSHGRVTLAPAAVVSALGLIGVVTLGTAGAATWLLILSACVAGMGTPPIGGIFRHRLPALVDRSDTSTAFVVDSLLVEVIFVTGPLLAGGLAATAGPAWALLIGALLGSLGTIWFTLLLPRHRREDVMERPPGGALGSPTVRVLVLAGVSIGGFFGALDVALPAFGVQHGNAALGGPFGASIAVGSVVGGLIYGLRPHALGAPRTALLRLAALQAIFVLPLLFAPSVFSMFFLAALSGLFVAPLISVRSELVGEGMVPGTGNETFSWISVSIALGASAGAALAGPLVEIEGWRAGVALACFASAMGFLLLFGRRRLL